jgi:hypothetical protein
VAGLIKSLWCAPSLADTFNSDIKDYFQSTTLQVDQDLSNRVTKAVISGFGNIKKINQAYQNLKNPTDEHKESFKKIVLLQKKQECLFSFFRWVFGESFINRFFKDTSDAYKSADLICESISSESLKLKENNIPVIDRVNVVKMCNENIKSCDVCQVVNYCYKLQTTKEKDSPSMYKLDINRLKSNEVEIELQLKDGEVFRVKKPEEIDFDEDEYNKQLLCSIATDHDKQILHQCIRQTMSNPLTDITISRIDFKSKLICVTSSRQKVKIVLKQDHSVQFSILMNVSVWSLLSNPLTKTDMLIQLSCNLKASQNPEAPLLISDFSAAAV